jgi:hypothetical protein
MQLLVIIKIKIWKIFLVFKLSPCCSNDKLSSGYFPGVWVLKADVSELCVSSIFNRWWPRRQFTMKNLNCKPHCQQLHLKYLCNMARYWLQAPWRRHDIFETCRIMIICEIILNLLVILQNKNKSNSPPTFILLWQTPPYTAAWHHACETSSHVVMTL